LIIIAAALNRFEYAPLIVVHMGIDTSSLGIPLDGFGFLVDPEEKKELLGCVWSSSLFPGRAPKGKNLVTLFIGGTRHPHVTDWDNAKITATAQEELTTILKLSCPPETIHITRYNKSIPQYNVGTRQIHIDLKNSEKKYAGLKWVGNFMDGISVGRVIKFATEKAR